MDNDMIFELATSINNVSMNALKDGRRIGFKAGFKAGFKKAIEKYAGSWVVGEDGKTLDDAMEEAIKEVECE